VPPGGERYYFNRDGASVIDPRNPQTSESNENTGGLIHVPGSERQAPSARYPKSTTGHRHSRSSETPRETVEMFQVHPLPMVYHETEGAPAWDKWRDYLNEFAPLLFQ
jgi:hypothetical protein